MRGWLDSNEHAAWVERAEPHAAGPTRTQFATGLETWFTLPAPPGATAPPPYKMALLTWITIFPLITGVVIVLGPWPRHTVAGDSTHSVAVARASGVLGDAYRDTPTKPGKGVHRARAIAEILRSAGCPEPVEIAGLLHDVVEDTPWALDQVRERFGATIAVLVAAVTEDAAIRGYRRRKRALRRQIAAAGPVAIDIALADKIASLSYALESGASLPRRKIAPYKATIALGDRAAHPALAAQHTAAGRARRAVAGIA